MYTLNLWETFQVAGSAFLSDRIDMTGSFLDYADDTLLAGLPAHVQYSLMENLSALYSTPVMDYISYLHWQETSMEASFYRGAKITGALAVAFGLGLIIGAA